MWVMDGAVGRRLVVLALASLLAMAALVPAAGSEDSATSLILVRADRDHRDLLPAIGLTPVEFYPSFVLARASEAQRGALSRLGVSWEDVTHQRMVHLASGAFDPLEGVPLVPQELRAPDDGNRFVIQFIGPVKARWKEAVEDLGGRFSHYLPHNAFVLTIPPEASEDLKSLSFVRWLGPYHPAYRLSPALEGMGGQVDVSILTFRGGLALTEAAVRSAGGTIRWAQEDARGGLVEATVDAEALPALARVDGVRWVEPSYPVAFHNNQAQWVIQSFSQDYRPLWDRGLHGEGQVVGVADTGIDTNHWAFYDPDHPVQFSDPPGSLPPDFSHRKIVNYHVVPPGGDTQDGYYHGTMTTSIVAGDNTVPGGNGTYNGMADKAKLTFTDFYGAVPANPPPPNYLLNLSYNDTARIQSSSFGSATTPGGIYTTNDMLADTFVWDHKDFVPLYSAGNGYRDTVTIASPASAKNTLGVGATENGLAADDMKNYSSGGPTFDGRLKPDIVSPSDEYTARDGTVNGFDYGGGTSAATPAAAGGVALVRQYFMEGWYPSGSKNPANGFSPSAALVRAVVINGAREATGYRAHWHTYNSMAYPNPDQGWGRMQLDDALYFSGDARKLWVVEHPGLTTGESAQFVLTVENASQPLEITLLWTDYPGDPGSDPSSPKLVNDLDMDVWSPGGSFFVGNVYSGSNPGGSVPGGGTYDRVNPMENILVLPSNAEVGDYTVTVTAYSVPQGEAGTGLQPFALVVTGGLAVDVTPPAAPALLSAVLTGSSLQDVRLTWAQSGDEGQPGGTVSYAVYAGDAYDSNGTGYEYVGGVPATANGTYVYDHVGAGSGDPLSHHYYVQANDSAGNVNWSGQAGKFSRDLQAGMQLVSVPLELADASAAAVFQTLDFRQVRRYDPLDPTDPWKSYAPAKVTNDLPAVDETMGLWVDVVTAGSLVVAGLVPDAVTVDLVPGWNLIGYPSFVSRQIGDALAGVPWSRVEGWDATTPYNLREMLASDQMEAGRAYWVLADSGGSITIG
jgi:hypothetical protein